MADNETNEVFILPRVESVRVFTGAGDIKVGDFRNDNVHDEVDNDPVFNEDERAPRKKKITEQVKSQIKQAIGAGERSCDIMRKFKVSPAYFYIIKKSMK